ncbi:MAG: DUF3797 domain-containing protein [Anaerovoracaceae bacterium]
MELMKVMVLLEKYTKCEDCGSDEISNGGHLRICEDIFQRKCPCGYCVAVNQDGKILFKKSKSEKRGESIDGKESN